MVKVIGIIWFLALFMGLVGCEDVSTSEDDSVSVAEETDALRAAVRRHRPAHKGHRVAIRHFRHHHKPVFPEPQTPTCFEGNIDVHDQADLAQLDGVVCINGYLNIAYSSDIVELDLPDLKEVHDYFVITFNSALETIDIPQLVLVQGVLIITNNEHLASCEGYEIVSQLTVIDGLKAGSLVSGNELDQCTNLGAGECYQWDVSITSQADLDRFSQVQCFKKPVVVESSTLSAASFPFLRRAGQGIYIQNSPMLINISFPELTHTNIIRVENNSQLSTCAVVDELNSFLDRQPEDEVTYITVQGNLDDGCVWPTN